MGAFVTGDFDPVPKKVYISLNKLIKLKAHQDSNHRALNNNQKVGGILMDCCVSHLKSSQIQTFTQNSDFFQTSFDLKVCTDFCRKFGQD